MTLYIILAWLAFDLIVFFIMWFEYCYYRYNLPRKCKKILESFTEEE